jgi:type IV fimbrial biogenesis protein FimT
MMVALAIVLIILALAVPRFGDWLKNSEIRTAADSLQNGLQQARNEAVRRNAAVEFRLTGGSAWEVRLADTTIADRVLVVRPSAEGSPNVVLTTDTAGLAGIKTLTFDGMGRRYPTSKTNTDGSVVLTRICVDLPSSVLAAADTHDLEIDIPIGGSVRMCDPKVSSTTDTRVCEGYPTACSAL